MASLNEILGDPKRCGVFRYGGDLDRLESAAERANLSLHKLDLSLARSKKDALKSFAKTLKFPTYFGENWDALDECLSDLDWLDAPGWMLIVTGAGKFAAVDEESLVTILDVLNSAAEYWSEEGKPFWAIVIGEGQTKGLANLKPVPEK